RSNCARAKGWVLPLRVVSCEASTAWTIRGGTLLSCAEDNAARMSRKRTTCDMRAKGTGGGCMDFSLLLHQPTARTKARRTPRQARIRRAPSSDFVQRVNRLAPWTRVAAGNMGRLWPDIITHF